MDWQPAEKVQKNDAGDYRAFINGAWVPVAKAQKNDAGEYRVMLTDAPPPAADKGAAPATQDVAVSAPYKAVAGLLDALPNASTDVANLARAGYGTLRTALGGSADTLPMYPHPDLARNALTAAGLIQPTPNMTGGQQMLDAGLQGATGGALMPANGLAGMVTNAALGGAGATTQGALSQGGSPAGQALGQVAGMAVPGIAGAGIAGLNRIAQPLRLGAKNNFLLSAADGRAPEIINALRDPGADIIPQVNTDFGRSGPTAGEAAAGVGATKFSAAQKAAASVLPTEYLDRTSANRVARAAQLETVSGTPAQQAGALNARETVSGALYPAAKSQSVPMDQSLNSILQRPAVQDALSAAEEISGNKGAGFNLRARPPSEISGRDTITNEPVTPPQISIGDLHNVKVNLDKQLRGLATATGAEAAKGVAIKQARDALVTWMDDNSPGYAVARGTYARQSGVINQQEVGQFLQDALAKPVGDGERPAVFANAMDNAARTIKSSTGQTRFQKLDEVLTPKQLEAVNGVRADLERGALMDEQASAASRSPPNIKTPSSELTSQALGGNSMPGMLSRVTMVANALVRRLQGKIDHKLAIQIATDMLDPAKTANALEGAMARRSQLSQNSMRDYSGLAPGVTNVLLGNQNALAPQ